MKLEGSLDAFSLPDVFQLLSLTKKTGGLHLADGQASGVVYFSGGSVTGACSNAARQSLARRLVGLGACDDAALRRAVERATSESVGVARALGEAGAVDGELLRQLALEQTIDAVFDLLRWSDGDFAFGVEEPNPDEVGLLVPAEQVVAQAAARRESWDAVSKVIPSPDVVLTMPVVVPTDQSVSRDEWALLAMVDSSRTVGELVEYSGAGQFTVVSTLTALVQRGMLSLRDEEAPDHIALVQRRQQLLAPLETGGAGSGDHQGAAVPAGAAAPTHAGGDVGAAAPAQTHRAPSVAAAASVPSSTPAAAQAAPGLLDGAHDPVNVVPPRPEPFMPKRVVEHPDPSRSAFSNIQGQPTAPPMAAGHGGGAAAAVQPVGESAIERDPTVNRSLMLRLIAGVRGL